MVNEKRERQVREREKDTTVCFLLDYFNNYCYSGGAVTDQQMNTTQQQQYKCLLVCSACCRTSYVLTYHTCLFAERCTIKYL